MTMVAKKKLLGLAAVLGAIAGGVIALVRMPSRTVVASLELVIPTNVVVQVAATNAAERGVKVKDEGEQRKIPNSIVQPSTSNLPPVKVRKPIVNDPKIPKARQVLLANRRIAVEKGRSFLKRFCQAQTPTARGTAPYVVISELPVSRDVRIQAVADGARVVGFLPNNALLVEADAQALKNLEEDVLFLAAVEYEPTDKIQRALLDKTGATVEATIVLLNPKDREVVQKFVTENGGTLLRGTPSEKSVRATIPCALIEQLAGKAEVKWIERCK